jgi:hypothetical protein
MTMKRVQFKPVAVSASAENDWVKGGGRNPDATPAAPAERMKRLTIDVPLSLHTRIKAGCALSERKIADVARDLLEREFPPS